MSLLDLGLAGKGAVVTGAAQGIGAGVARALGALGVKVAILDLETQAELAAGVVADIEAGGGTAMFVPTDASDAVAVEAAVAATAGAWGALHIAVGCVGGGLNARASVLDQTLEAYHRLLAVTQHSAFYLVQAAARRMKAQGTGGKIVVTGSIMADFSSPNASCYSAAKAALRQMAMTAANELGPHGINVNVIQPGWIDTPGERRVDPENVPKQMDAVAKRLPKRRMGQPKDIANLAAFLCSDAADYITGSVLDCDGGYKVAMSI